MNYVAARTNMVEHQVLANRVHDHRVSNALSALPREMFLPKDKRSFAYLDREIDLGQGRFALDTMVLGRLADAANITDSDVVLCLGDPTGYAAAVLAQLAQTVVAVEPDPTWLKFANDALSAQNIDNVVVVTGDPLKGLPSQAPYDVILFCGAIPSITADLCNQLSDGGRLLAVLRQPGSPMGRATLALRSGDRWSERDLFDAGVPLLAGVHAQTGFVF